MNTERGIDPRPIKKLDTQGIFFLIGCALICDTISIVPGMNVVMGIVGQALVPFVFSKYGIHVFSLRRIVPYIGASIIEIVPSLSVIPAFTLETLIIILLSKRYISK